MNVDAVDIAQHWGRGHSISFFVTPSVNGVHLWTVYFNTQIHKIRLISLLSFFNCHTYGPVGVFCFLQKTVFKYNEYWILRLHR